MMCFWELSGGVADSTSHLFHFLTKVHVLASCDEWMDGRTVKNGWLIRNSCNKLKDDIDWEMEALHADCRSATYLQFCASKGELLFRYVIKPPLRATSVEGDFL
uniref:uncharacterized protein LOC105351240 n=1 Tax=Fragaria vesca subsp. vesca TaxID=101020 RepID=UPI0005C9D5F8|nr:PREDICTED: uncharacterized protein LOC105351240 [Fragaria vesca subsp. vesca]